MIEKNKILIKCIVMVVILGIIATGCSKEDIIVEENQEEEIIQDVVGKDNDILVRSENISNLVVNLYGIDNATAIIFNDVVAIGLEMADSTKLTNDIKEMIIDTVLENDTMIRQVLITDNKKLFEQIENVILSLMNGRPYDDYVKEINRIIEKLKKE